MNQPDSMQETFVGEGITPEDASFSTSAMAMGTLKPKECRENKHGWIERIQGIRERAQTDYARKPVEAK